MPKSLINLLFAIALIVPSPGYSSAQDEQRAVKSLFMDITTVGNRLIAVGQHGHIIYSDDNGQNWSWADSPVDSLLTSVFFVDEAKGWASGHDGMIIFSEDKGLSWQVQYNGLEEAKDLGKLRVEEATRSLSEIEQRFIAAKAKGDHNIDLELELDDARVSLELATLSIHQPEADPFMDLWFRDAHSGIAVGAFGKVMSTENGGQTWVDISDNLENFDGFHLYSITANQQNRILVAGEGGSVFRSNDFGDSWEKITTPYEGSFFGANALSDNQVVIYGLRGNLLHSSDYGDTWRALNIGLDKSLFGAHSFNGRTVVVGDAGVNIEIDNQSHSIQAQQFNNRLPILNIVHTSPETVFGVGPLGPVKLTISMGAE